VIKLYLLSLLLLFSSSDLSFANPELKKTRVLIVTGGHDFERKQFFEVFESYPDVAFTEVIQPAANALIDSKEVNKFDVLVFYDMYQEITEEQKSAYLQLLEKGKGMVFLHHSLVSYQEWDEFLNIVGGRYYLSSSLSEADQDKVSDYSHDENMHITIKDEAHAINKGLEDFTIRDETYANYEVLPEVHVLLTTDHPKSTTAIAWCHEYRASRVVYLQLGHDHHAFEHPKFRKFLHQSIDWVTGQ